MLPSLLSRLFLPFATVLVALAATSCRIVSTYQPAPPILSSPSEGNKGEVNFTTNLINLNHSPLFGLTTLGVNGWVSPALHLLIGWEGFYWHDQSKFRIRGSRLQADLGDLYYSGASNGISGGLSLGTYWVRERITWVAMGGYAQEYAFSSHNANYYNRNIDSLGFRDRRRTNWGKPWLQGHMLVNLGGAEKDADRNLYFMLGYRVNMVITGKNTGQTDFEGLPDEIERLRQERLFRYVFSGPETFAFMHQPFVAFKAEGRSVTGGIRVGLNIGGNRLYWHHAPYSIEPMLAFKF